MTPRPYQVEARKAVHNAWQKHQRVLVVHPTGTGKTVLFSLVADDILRQGGRVLILAHRHELLQQAQQKLMSVTGIDSVVEKAEETALGSMERVTVGSVQTLMNLSRLERFPRSYYSHIVVDECHHCFPAGTLVDGKKIETFTAGDLVYCYDHERNKVCVSHVEKTMSRDVDSICEVFFSNGKIIVCTEDHPFFNGSNYVAASTLLCNDMVYEQIHESKDLFGLRSCLRAEIMEQPNDSVLFGTVQEKGKGRTKKDGSGVLRSVRKAFRFIWKKIISTFKRKDILQHGMQQRIQIESKFYNDGKHEQETRIVKNDAKQPNEESRCEDQNDSVYEREGSEDPRRKRIEYPCPASTFMDRNSRIGVSRNYGTSDMYSTSVSSVSIGEVSTLLQTGHRVSSRENIRRNRWVFPLLTKKETTGRQKNSGLRGVRVEGVAIHKRGSGTRFDRLCPNGCVYNLQVAEHNNYFAENILVHNCLTDSYQRIFSYFENAKVLGVTATPDRGDLKDLGRFFETKAHEYLLPQAIADGYLCKIRAQMIPLNIDLNSVKCGTDFDDTEVGNALRPYIPKIAEELWKICKNRKLLIFAPLCAIAQDIRDAMAKVGFNSFYASGEYRDEMKAWNAAGKGACMVNAMLLTEGYDHPLIDAVCVLRPTKVRALYSQMIGRGTRIHPLKDYLLVPDFLWHSERHSLCHPAHLLAENDEVAEIMVKKSEATAGGEPEEVDTEALAEAQTEFLAQKEEVLAKKLAEQRRKKAKLVDPLQFALSIGDEGIADYEPAMQDEGKPATLEQMKFLEEQGLATTDMSQGLASRTIEALHKRKSEGLALPKQIRFLERLGFKHVGKMKRGECGILIGRISANNWRVPENLMHLCGNRERDVS